MTKEQREKYLKKLSILPEGEALKEFFLEKIKELSDISSAQNWEDVLGRQAAIIKLREILFTLNLLKEEDKEKEKKNEYI